LQQFFLRGHGSNSVLRAVGRPVGAANGANERRRVSKWRPEKVHTAGLADASPIKSGRRVILTERSEVDGESRRQPAVSARADSNGAWKRVFPFLAVVVASRHPL
jgi:hypothetical protein